LPFRQTCAAFAGTPTSPDFLFFCPYHDPHQPDPTRSTRWLHPAPHRPVRRRTGSHAVRPRLPERAALIDAVVPANIRRKDKLDLGQFFEPLPEQAALAKLKGIASQNKVMKSMIGQGYYGTHTPPVILRNIFENPAWYTAYTPYQPEISQGRLEAILNFQQVITDLTGMGIANASMLDEGTAAAEAMTLIQRVGKSASKVFYVADDVLPQTLEVVETRAKPIGVEVRTIAAADIENLTETCFGVLLQYPGVNGDVRDYRNACEKLHAAGAMVVVAADLLALTVLTPPGEWGADVVVGNSQRFGVPLGFGGPHAGYLATRDEFKRSMAGRLAGVTVDAQGNKAFRLALQTREQHIRREKATSNICTAQVLLAVMASMYAIYHGPKGLSRSPAACTATPASWPPRCSSSATSWPTRPTSTP
jgi:glycine dehydrogenase